MRYRVQDLGTRFAPRSFGIDGRIFGTRTEGEEPNFRRTLAVYDNGGLLDLWTIPPRLRICAANARGWLTGHSWEPHHAFRFADGVFTDLGTLYGRRSCGYAINDQGWIAGWTVAPGSGEETWQQGYRAMLVADGKMIDLAPDGGDHARAHGINNLGEIVGTGIGEQGFLCRYRTGWLRRFAFFTPHAINNRGDIAGIVRHRPAVAKGYRPPPLDLGLPADRVGISYRVNSRGTVIGTDWPGAPQRAWLTDRRFFVCRDWSYAPLQTLFPPESGWQPLTVPQIDDHDRIAGIGLYYGERRGYLLTPEDEDCRPEPEDE